MTEVRVRLARNWDRDRLVELWERAVRATHAFLDERDILALRPVTAQELASDAIEWWVAVNAADTPIGFLGRAGDAIEGLFIDPDHLRQGTGTLLVAHAQALSRGSLTVEVNEQNEAAVRFYASLGFIVVARSAEDGDGRPFPTLRMHRVPPG